MPFLHIAGERFRYETGGLRKGPALVLAHSLGTRLEMWDALVPHLAHRFHVIRYDARGHGQSVAPDAVYSMGDLGRDLINILDALDVPQVHLCGLSLGGMVGQWMAVNAPQRLDRLVLANTTAHAGPHRLWEGRIKAVRKAGTAPIADAVVESWFTPAFRQAAPAEVARVRSMVVETPALGYAATSCAMRDMDFRHDLAQVHTPTLVVIGAQDRSTPPEWGELIASHIPGAQKAVLDTGHMSAIEAPGDFAASLIRFLA